MSYTYESTSTKFTREQLDTIAERIQKIEFDQVFSLDTEGVVHEVKGIRAPSLTSIEQHPGILVDGVEGESAQWSPLTGLSNQDHYSGPIMHPSEQVSAGVVRAMLDTLDDETGPGTYPNHLGYFALCVVEVEPGEGNRISDDDTLVLSSDEEPAGWAIVRRDMRIVHLLDEAERMMRHEREVRVTRLDGTTQRGWVDRVDDDGFVLDINPAIHDDKVFLFASHVENIAHLDFPEGFAPLDEALANIRRDEMQACLDAVCAADEAIAKRDALIEKYTADHGSFQSLAGYLVDDEMIPTADESSRLTTSRFCPGTKRSDHEKVPGRKYSYCSVCGKKVGHYADGRLRNHVPPKK